jgi:hypothetical protein
MVVHARLRGDEERLAQLEEVGDRLIQNARRQQDGGQENNEYIALIESWAAEFRFDSYRATETENGIAIEFERPEQVEQILAPRNAELQITSTLYGFQNRYSGLNDSPGDWPVEELPTDLVTARSIADGGIPQDFMWPEDSLTAVASAAIRAHVLGLRSIKDADLAWAAETLMLAAENPRIDDMSYHGTHYSMGADRAAAVALPLLLSAAFDSLGLDHERVDGCLLALASSMFDEVRMAYAEGCEPLWSEPCDKELSSGRCLRHRAAWDAAVASLADCRLGPWSIEAQRRVPQTLLPPFQDSLPTIGPADLLVNHLRMPVVCMVDARASSCLMDAVGDLWDPLWDAHRRGLERWWREGYDHGESMHHEPIARRLIDMTIQGETEPLEAHLITFAENANALHLLLESLTTVFTYDERLRHSLPTLWPRVMLAVLDAVGDGARPCGESVTGSTTSSQPSCLSRTRGHLIRRSMRHLRSAGATGSSRRPWRASMSGGLDSHTGSRKLSMQWRDLREVHRWHGKRRPP